MPITDTEMCNIKKMVRLEVREYFDHFLEHVLPKIIEAHINACPHGRKVTKFRWVLVGIGVALIAFQAAPALGKVLLSIVV